MQHDVIIACDFKSAEDTFRFLDLFKDEERKPFLKIGMELFYAEGPAIVRRSSAGDHRIFLDLKLHDIPNTVKKAMAVLSRLDVDMCNVHAAGTIEMMRAAREGLTREDGTPAPADRRDAAHFDQRGAHAGGTSDRRLDQRHDREIRAEHPGGRAGRRGLLARWKPAWCTGRAARSF